jgi:hypothetical protein
VAEPPPTDLYLFGTSVDYNKGWQIANGDRNATVNLTGDHVEAPSQWAISYGQLYVTDSYFTNGTSSGMLGYLIDNENPSSSITNTVLAGGGTGTIFNGNGQLLTMLGVQSTTGGAAIGIPIGGTAGVFYTDVLPQLQVIGQAKNGFPIQGNGLAWNLAGGTGESDFINNHGGGSGGWNFYDCSGACKSQILAATVGAHGEITTKGPSTFFASGTTTMPPSALSANTCSSTVTVATSGVKTSMHINWNLASSPVGVNGYGNSPVTIYAWLTNGMSTSFSVP